MVISLLANNIRGRVYSSSNSSHSSSLFVILIQSLCDSYQFRGRETYSTTERDVDCVCRCMSMCFIHSRSGVDVRYIYVVAVVVFILLYCMAHTIIPTNNNDIVLLLYGRQELFFCFICTSCILLTVPICTVVTI